MRFWKLAKKNNTLKEVYGLEVSRRIHERYSIDQELAFLRNRDRKPEEFAEYDAFAENCKSEVKKELGGLENE